MKGGIATATLVGATIVAGFALAQVKGAPRCPTEAHVELGITAPKGWSATKIANRLPLQEAHVEGSTVSCRYGALAKSPIELTTAVPAGMTCSVAEDGKTVRCKNVIGPLASAD